jgi:VCBS repeat protein/FG-GAP repeat protein
MRRVDRFLRDTRAALLIIITISQSGCAAGMVGLWAWISSSTGSQGAVNRPPAAPVIQSVTRRSGGRVTISYSLVDDDGGGLDVTCSWRPAGAGDSTPFVRVDLVPLPGAGPIVVEPNLPRSFEAVWDAGAALAAAGLPPSAQVMLQMIATEDAGSSLPGTAGPFVVGNEPPDLAVLELDPDATFDVASGGVSGIVPLDIVISDSTRDRVRLTMRYSEFEGPWRCMAISSERESRADCSTATLFDSAMGEDGGQRHKVFWNSVHDVPGRFGQVKIEVIAHDELDPDAVSRKELTLAVDNNSDPFVELVAIEASIDKAYEIPIRFIARDHESNPVAVLLQWATQGAGFPDLPVESLASPTSQELNHFQRLLTPQAKDPCEGSAPPEECEIAEERKRLHLLTEADLTVEGPIDDSDGLPLDTIQVSEIIRRGLLLLPSGPENPTPWPAPPFDDRMFPVGRDLQVLPPPPVKCQGATSPGAGSSHNCRIRSFDPRTSAAVISPALEAPLQRGSRFRLRMNECLQGLTASPEGAVHTFLWDAVADMRRAGISLDSKLMVRATALDTQATVAPPTFFDLESGPLVREQTLSIGPLGGASSALAAGNLDGERLPDLVTVQATSGGIDVYYQSQFGRFPSSPNLSWQLGVEEGPVSAMVADVTGDGLSDVLVVNRFSSTVHIHANSGANPPIDPTPSCLVRTGLRPLALALGDVTGDGRSELLVANSASDSVSVFLPLDQAPAGSPCLFKPDADLILETADRPLALALGDVDGEGHGDVLVVNEGPGATGSVSIFLHTAGLPGKPSSDGVPSHRQASYVLELALNSRPSALDVRDLDGDGLLDLVVLESLPAAVRIFHQHGGTLIEDVEALRLPALAPSLAVGDFDGNGRPDIAVSNSADKTVSLFLQQVEGFPAVPQQVLLTDGGPASLLAWDFNQDGGDDLIASTAFGTLDRFSQRRRGALLIDEPHDLQTGLGPVSAAIADFNGDGRKDLAIANRTDQTVSVFLQDLTGNFPSRSNQLLGTGEAPEAGSFSQNPRLLAAGDLDGDGRADLAMASRASTRLSIFLQRPEGQMGKRPGGEEPAVSDQKLAAGIGPSSVSIADVNGDGQNDVVLSVDDTASPGARVFYQESPGAFSGAKVVGAGAPPASVVVGDVDGDGLLDLLMTIKKPSEDGKLLVFHQMGQAGTHRGVIPAEADEVIPVGNDLPGLIQVADFDGDGRQDVLVANRVLNSVRLFLQKGECGLDEPQLLQHEQSPSTDIAVLDVDGDGRKDFLGSLINTPQGAGRVVVLFQRPGRPFTLHDSEWFHLVPQAAGVHSMIADDLNGDGHDDLLITNPGTRSATLYFSR